jgi:anti-anti-sigma factor
LQVYEVGPTTVVGFGGRDILDDVNVALCRDELLTLTRDHGCQTLAVDMTGVRLVPSGLLGLLTSIRGRGVDVHIYNPSPDVREVLSVTNLDRLFPIHEVKVEVPPPND